MKSLIIWSVVVLAIVGSLFAIYKVAQAPSGGSAGGVAPEVSEIDRTKGPKDAKAVLIEYSDFQCPACASFFPAVEELNEELSGELLFVYRHFPLPQHKNAELTAYAAEAAGLQGKFFEMHDEIFKNQNEWAEEKDAKEFLKKYAQAVGLDVEKFLKDLDSREVKDKVSADISGALRAKVNATPTFFLNGKKVEGFRTYDEFKNIVREAVRNGS